MDILSADISLLYELVRLEKTGFPGSEAAGRDAFLYRIKNFPRYFLVCFENGELIGLIDGVLSDKDLIEDDVYSPSGGSADGKNLLILGLVVRPDMRRRGIAALLMKKLLSRAVQDGLNAAALTCKKELISYYERFGFVNRGVSSSVLGDIVWYDMTLDL